MTRGPARIIFLSVAGIQTMVEEGIVHSVEDDALEVRIVRPSACASCAARGACMTLGPSERIVRVVREPGGPEVGEGDRVRLQIRSTTFLRASLVGYLVPTLAFFAGVGGVLLAVPPGGTLLGMGRDLAGFLAGAAGVVLTFAVVWAVGASPSRRARYAPRILDVVPGDGAPGC